MWMLSEHVIIYILLISVCGHIYQLYKRAVLFSTLFYFIVNRLDFSVFSGF